MSHMQKISPVARPARVLVFLDQDRAVHNFVAAGAFSRLVERHRVSFVVPPRDKRMAMDPAAVKAILTGGLSQAAWATRIDGVDAIDPDLTLKGLAILHAEVAGGEPLKLGLA